MTTEAVAQLTATVGQQLLSLKNTETELGDAFVRVIQVLHTLLDPSKDPPNEKPARQLQVATIRRAAQKIVKPMWDLLGAWLDLMRVEIEASKKERKCFSAVCRSGGQCYSSICNRVVNVAATQRRIGGSVAALGKGFAARAAPRIVTMLFAYVIHLL